MRAKTKKKHEMGKRFAIVIGVAAAAVMVLGAQTALAATGGHFEGKVEGGGGIHFDTTTIRKGKTKQVFVDTLTQVPVSCDERNGLLNLQILPEPGQGITGTQVVGDNSLRVKHGSFRFTPEDQPGGQTITFRGKFNKTAKKATGTYRAQGDHGDRKAHDHTRQVGTTGSRAWRLGTSRAPRFWAVPGHRASAPAKNAVLQRTDGSRLRTPGPRLSPAQMYRECTAVSEASGRQNRHRSLGSSGGPTPRLEGGPR